MPDTAGTYAMLNAFASLFSLVLHRLWAEVCRTGAKATTFKSAYQKRFGLTARHFNSVRIQLEGMAAAAAAAQRRHSSMLGVAIWNLLARIERMENRLKALRSNAKKRVLKAQMRQRVERERLSALRERLATAEASARPNTGKVAHLRACIARSEDRLETARAWIHDEGTKRQRLARNIHHCKRRLRKLTDRKVKVDADIAAGRVRISFGGRRLFRHQFALKKSGFRSHAEWRQAWRRARSSQFLCVGAGEETSGNVTCTLLPDGRIRLRLPDALVAQNGGDKYLYLAGVVFTRGSGKRKHPVPDIQAAIAAGKPVAYRFVRRERKGREVWYVQATVDVEAAPVVTSRARGALGVDFNPTHVDAMEIDHSGNPLRRSRRTIPVRVVGRTHAQAKASLCEAAADLVAQALSAGKPIVIERPVFHKVKAQIRYRSPRLARLLSSFAFDAFRQAVLSRAARNGVEVIEVNPAFTSVIGFGKFGPGYGLSCHEAASVAIGRRGLEFGEWLRSRSALALPARNRARHVWNDWGHQSQWLRDLWLQGKIPGVGAKRGRRPFEGSPGGGRPLSRTEVAFPSGDGIWDTGVKPPGASVGNAVRPATGRLSP